MRGVQRLLQLPESAPLHRRGTGRNKRAMTPFSAKTTTLGEAGAKEARAAPHALLSGWKRVKNRVLTLDLPGWGVWRGGKAAASRPEVVCFASQRPRITRNKLVCEPLSLCTRRSL